MIFDHLNNISLYQGLSSDLYLGLEFIKQATPNLSVGTHQLNPWVRAIVSEYETKPVSEYGFEAHKKYIDIQGLLIGEERVAFLPIEQLTETHPYSEEKEAAFYAAEGVKAQEMTIGNGYFAIFHPQDGHMPQLCVAEQMRVKKVVVKVKIK